MSALEKSPDPEVTKGNASLTAAFDEHMKSQETGIERPHNQLRCTLAAVWMAFQRGDIQRAHMEAGCVCHILEQIERKEP